MSQARRHGEAGSPELVGDGDKYPVTSEPGSPVIEADELLEVAAKAALDKKALGALALRVGEHLSIVDWFLVIRARGKRQVETIYEEIDKRLGALGVSPIGTEGIEDAEWILLDYGDVVVHVMTEEAASFYALERLWSDVARRDLAAELEAV